MPQQTCMPMCELISHAMGAFLKDTAKNHFKRGWKLLTEICADFINGAHGKNIIIRKTMKQSIKYVSGYCFFTSNHLVFKGAHLELCMYCMNDNRRNQPHRNKENRRVWYTSFISVGHLLTAGSFARELVQRKSVSRSQMSLYKHQDSETVHLSVSFIHVLSVSLNAALKVEKSLQAVCIFGLI